MKTTTIILMLLFSITAVSQNQFTKQFETAELVWLGYKPTATVNRMILDIAKIKIEPLEIDKEKTILILTVQKKTVKWYKFRQRAIFRREIKNLN